MTPGLIAGFTCSGWRQKHDSSPSASLQKGPRVAGSHYSRQAVCLVWLKVMFGVSHDPSHPKYHAWNLLWLTVFRLRCSLTVHWFISHESLQTSCGTLMRSKLQRVCEEEGVKMCQSGCFLLGSLWYQAHHNGWYIYLYIMYKCSCFFFLQYHSHVRLPQNPDAEVYSQLPLITSY